MTGVQLPFHPRLFLLLNFEYFQVPQLVLLANLLTAATMSIVENWKSKSISTIGALQSKVKCVCLMSKLTAICQYRLRNITVLEPFSKLLISPVLQI